MYSNVLLFVCLSILIDCCVLFLCTYSHWSRINCAVIHADITWMELCSVVVVRGIYLCDDDVAYIISGLCSFCILLIFSIVDCG